MVSEHAFAADCVQPKCAELKRACAQVESTLADKRAVLHQLVDLYDCLEASGKWSLAASRARLGDAPVKRTIFSRTVPGSNSANCGT